jgi:hypothetical protein
VLISVFLQSILTQFLKMATSQILNSGLAELFGGRAKLGDAVQASHASTPTNHNATTSSKFSSSPSSTALGFFPRKKTTSFQHTSFLPATSKKISGPGASAFQPEEKVIAKPPETNGLGMTPKEFGANVLAASVLGAIHAMNAIVKLLGPMDPYPGSDFAPP